MEFQYYLLLIIAGAAGGFMSGLLGVGGGIIFIPLLDFIFTMLGVPESEKVRLILANSLFIIFFTGLLSTHKQYKMGYFYPKAILATALPGIITSIFASWLIGQGTWYSETLFKSVFLILLVPMVLKLVKGSPKKGIENQVIEDKILNVKWNYFLPVGAITGIITSFSGLGGGVVMIPAFVNYLKTGIKKATAISVGVIPFFALFQSIFYMINKPQIADNGIAHWGYIYFGIDIPVIIGTALTAAWGVSVSHKLPERTIRISFGTFTALVSIKMIIEIIQSL